MQSNACHRFICVGGVVKGTIINCKRYVDWTIYLTRGVLKEIRLYNEPDVINYT